VAPIAEQLLGVAITAGAAGCSAIRARVSHPLGRSLARAARRRAAHVFTTRRSPMKIFCLTITTAKVVPAVAAFVSS
jgi:hypothetical protein